MSSSVRIRSFSRNVDGEVWGRVRTDGVHASVYQTLSNSMACTCGHLVPTAVIFTMVSWNGVTET